MCTTIDRFQVGVENLMSTVMGNSIDVSGNVKNSFETIRVLKKATERSATSPVNVLSIDIPGCGHLG